MRTLVISDLHLGNRAHHDVLRMPAPLELLLAALDDVERLVVLGDLAELVRRHPRRSLVAAEPVLRAIGHRMYGKEVVLVPGNHDAPLIRNWVRAQGASLSLDSTIETGATRALARVAWWLDPALVRVHYPGVWLDEGIYATHGHYLDHHLIPESPIGLPRGRLGPQPRSHASPHDYEQGRIRSHHGRDTLPSRALARPLAAFADAIAGVARTAILPHLPRLLLNAQLAPLSAALTDVQMRRAALPAMARVLARLGVQADWVIFGHVHRLGPLDSDNPKQWHATDGAPRLLNSGSWLYEPALIDRASPPHPYWPGGAIIIEPGRAPRAVSLLDGLDVSQLRLGSGPG